MVRQAVREAFILILTAVGIALAVYALRPDKVGDRSASVSGDVGAGLATESPFSEISIEEAVRLFRQSLRSPSHWTGHPEFVGSFPGWVDKKPDLA